MSEEFLESAVSQCQSIGVVLTVKNEGHHWMFRSGSKTVDWWPSSAKLVIEKRFRDGIHAHDWTQVWPYIEKHFGSIHVAPSRVIKIRGPEKVSRKHGVLVVSDNSIFGEGIW